MIPYARQDVLNEDVVEEITNDSTVECSGEPSSISYVASEQQNVEFKNNLVESSKR